ncbi:substrate of the Dot/Icm secretion system [Legionella steigerwaltii]|uniref:Substrate of the Dot/Icm secretion system n=1 Tax=Legionella steigerwaltii TaxID=460 RepID=A0A378L825_9GAMM|nr:hypothetical protein [Legionella steigerwaltii]KTD77557.1 substrate of the Dot/Icm secretion system [Legionella steigerwaltii]STY22867.1 substrate of the Dot/Icm secretion system [Legionella steigerwaltii]
MSLSKLNINALVEQLTDSFIVHANYSELRDSCILMSPISSVTNDVERRLELRLKMEQPEASLQLTLDTCKKQLQHDLNEEKDDLREELNDSETSKRLLFNLSSTQEKIRAVDQEMRELSLQIEEIKTRIALQEKARNKIDEESTQHQNTHSHGAHTHPEQNPKTTHAHPELVDQQAKTVHEHSGHTEQHAKTTHTHSESDQHLKTTHTHQEKSHHGHQESDPILLKRRLEAQLELLKSSSSTGHKKHNEYETQLKLVLEKIEQRKLRALERETRARARLTNDPDLLQLSQSNLNLLNEAISRKHKELQKKQQQLMQTTLAISYQTYLDRLEIYLQSVTPLSYQENTSLKQIIILIRSHLSTKREENKVTLERNEAALRKEQAIEEKRQKENMLAHIQKSNPELTSLNVALKEQNQQLAQTIEEQHSYRNSLLKIGLFFLLFTGGAAGTGIAIEGELIALTSLLLAPAAVLGVITLSLFIAALVYTIKNSMDNNQLNKNQTTMEDNQSTIERQNSELTSLVNDLIPLINEQISNAENNLIALDKRINELHQLAELQLNMAKLVTVKPTSEQSFFVEQMPQDTHQTLAPPSAPLMEENIDKSDAFSYS